MNFPKFQYFRSKKHLQNVSKLPCMVCGLVGQTQAAHSNQAIHGKAKALKASDQFTAALCDHHHYEIDQGRTLSRSERVEMWNTAHESTVIELKRLGIWPELP